MKISKQIAIISIIIITISCKTKKQTFNSAEAFSDNLELIEIYKKDQLDRSGNYDDVDWELLGKNDSLRRIRVIQLLDSNKVRTSLDYKNAAMIFQHGLDSTHYRMAVEFMKKSVDLDSTTNKWLLAAAIDRHLLSMDKPQIYGTQYYRKGPDAPWESAEIDTTKISDYERLKYGVPTLAEQKERVKAMNRTKLIELINSKSIESIIEIIENEDKNDPIHDISEKGLNSFGYALMKKQKDEDALKIFKLNIKLYPNAFNTYDSYAECLLKMGNKEAAIENYKKSIGLNPNNENAIKILKSISSINN
ncbi:tetratricopeptide repeat protein [Mariniflexile gromovii]|uniref:Tetratricopeptide repeat protein n=1 Tax=Mariniflexile gromovii TaxID=362523 RepID=A0ABS4BW46_9FLAO|nr:tetratricopeptide repeat protein [Mariniflexile gromovii]MBP0904808.1 tetratricopeptide repeat protein [Mariniflexile gromovii]